MSSQSANCEFSVPNHPGLGRWTFTRWCSRHGIHSRRGHGLGLRKGETSLTIYRMINPYDPDDESWLDTRPDPLPVKKRKEDSLWVVHMSHHPVAAKRGLLEGFICVGWVKAGYLSQYRDQEQFKAAFHKCYPGHPLGRIANWAGDARRFVCEMDLDDLFVFPVTGKDEVHIGQITGDYRFTADDPELIDNDSASIRNVKWLKTVRRGSFSKAALLCFDSEHTVHSGSGYRSDVLDILGWAKSSKVD